LPADFSDRNAANKIDCILLQMRVATEICCGRVAKMTRSNKLRRDCCTKQKVPVNSANACLICALHPDRILAPLKSEAEIDCKKVLYDWN
jgi:hypothetical protein